MAADPGFPGKFSFAWTAGSTDVCIGRDMGAAAVGWVCVPAVGSETGLAVADNNGGLVAVRSLWVAAGLVRAVGAVGVGGALVSANASEADAGPESAILNAGPPPDEAGAAVAVALVALLALVAGNVARRTNVGLPVD